MLSVSPLAQGKGIGKKLLSTADEFARHCFCHSIYMTVISEKKELIAWYTRHGYRLTGEIVPFPVDERFGVPVHELTMMMLEKKL